MVRKRKELLLIILFLLALSWVAYAQTLCLSGSLYRRNPHGTTPIAANGYRVYLYNPSAKWIGPALTDFKGRYAFYDITRGIYLMRVYDDGRKVWEQEVQVPDRIKPIVLP